MKDICRLRGSELFCGRSALIIGSLVILLLASSGPCESQPAADTAQKIDPSVLECLAPGNKAAEANNFDQAINDFNKCAEKFPQVAYIQFLLGMAHFYKKDAEKAVTHFKKCMQMEPNNLDATAMIGRIYAMDKEKLAVARELLERVLSAAPYRDDVRFDVARVYAQQGEIEKALQQFRVILSEEPKFGLYHTELARLLLALGNKEAAKKELSRAMAILPDFEPAKELLRTIDKEPATPATKPEGSLKSK